MRYGDHNFRNRQLYEECHENPYYQKKLELMAKKQQKDEEIVYSTRNFIKNFMNDHNGGTPRWLRGIFYDEKEKIETILEYMVGIEQLPSREAVEKAVEQSIIDQHITMERARIIEEAEEMQLNALKYFKINNAWIADALSYNQAITDIIKTIKNHDTLD